MAMAKKTPSLENLPPLSSDEEINCVQPFSDSKYSPTDGDGVSHGSCNECGTKKQSASFSSVKTFFKNRSSERKTTVTPITNLSQKPKRKEVDDGNGLVVTRIFDRNRFSHASTPLDSYLNVPLPPGFIPSEIIVPVDVFQDDVKFERFLKHRFGQCGTQRVLENSSTNTVKSYSSREMSNVFQIPAEGDSLPAGKVYSSSRPTCKNGYKSLKEKKHTASRKQMSGVTNMQKDQTLFQPSEFGCQAPDHWSFPDTRDELQSSHSELKTKNMSFSRFRRNAVKHAAEPSNQRWATPCGKVPHSGEHICAIASNCPFCLKGAADEVQYEHRTLETFLSKECSGHRRSAICEEIENVKQTAKVNGLKMNLRLFREDLACVNAADKS